MSIHRPRAAQPQWPHASRLSPGPQIILLVLLLFCFAGATQAASPTRPLDPVKARLVPESSATVAGTTLWVDLHLDIAPGWHIYWRNPGDSGLPTEITWTLPAGFAAGEIAWPAPERFVVGNIGNYGYAGSADLLVPIAVSGSLAAGSTVHLAAHAAWLVCSEICIPGEKQLALDLPAASGPISGDPSVAALFAAARERLPKSGSFKPRFSLSEREVRLFVPAAALSGLTRPTAAFFPLIDNVIDAGAEPNQVQRSDGVELMLARATGPTAKMPDTLDGVLVLRGTEGGERAYTVAAPRAAPVPSDAATAIGWSQALLLALLGGIALNLMPCVFPVLSLKLLGLADAAHRAEQRRHGLAYALGVILSFAALGGVLLLLRAGGAAIGWGFQLQSPVVVALLAYLLFAMGLSLSGAAEFGAGFGGVGGQAAGRGGLVGAFATGVLATIVATPCTAPFMGAALGFALIAPVPLALAIFLALGCGLAAPVALASAVPGLARLLPRPGPWMVWLKQLLAFPLYVTVAWLIWVLIQEVGGAGAFSALLGLVAVGFAVWIYGRTRPGSDAGRRIGMAATIAGIAAAFLAAVMLSPTAGPPDAVAARDGLAYEPFTTDRLAKLEAEHQRVFVNLTAAWCITCLVNEHTTLDSAAIRNAFAQRSIVALKGDWTRQDPDITEFLQKNGRSGVPLYLLYDRGGATTVLPQLLTEANLLAALDKI